MPNTVETLGEINGSAFQRVTLRNAHAKIQFLTLGVVTQSWKIPTQDGELDVVLGFDDPFDYRENPDYLGTTVGRVANRIANGSFELEGQRYQLTQNGPNLTLHGGINGLSSRMWTLVDAQEDFARFSYFSPHLEEGFPGNVEFSLAVKLKGAALTYEITATTDRPTPINFAQHNYYNLLGQGPIWDHKMQIMAEDYTPLNDDLLPTGEVASIAGTPYDFRVLRSFDEADPARNGMDMAYQLPTDRNLEDVVARVVAPNGVELSIKTDQPCLQTYNGNSQSIETSGKLGRRFGRCSAICIEPQKHSNDVNTPSFPSSIVTPDAPYSYFAEIEIAQK